MHPHIVQEHRETVQRKVLCGHLFIPSFSAQKKVLSNSYVDMHECSNCPHLKVLGPRIAVTNIMIGASVGSVDIGPLAVYVRRC